MNSKSYGTKIKPYVMRVMVLALFLFSQTVPASVAQRPASASAAAQTTPGDMSITFEATATRQYNGPIGGQWTADNITAHLKGSATVQFTTAAGGLPGMRVTTSYLLTGQHTVLLTDLGNGCYKSDQKRYITNPALHALSTQDDNYRLLQPVQSPAGSWYISGYDVLSLISLEPYIEQNDDTNSYCDGSTTSDSFTTYALDIAPIVSNAVPEQIMRQADGVSYRFSGTVQRPALPWEGPTIVNWTITIVPTCKGAGRPVLDASDPNVTNLDITLDGPQDILPNDLAALTARVTCEGVPVQNAQLNISVKPRVGSGGHTHDELVGGSTNRPRGYLNDTKITASQPGITLTTGPQGEAAVTFVPGKDALNETIGIAGDYEITARSTHFPAQAQLTVSAGYPNLITMPDDDPPIYKLVGWTPSHFGNHYATFETGINIISLANAWQQVLSKYPNDGIPDCNGVAPLADWPPALAVNDISLPRGGLFDVRGWDVQVGRVRGAPWQPPHYTHVDGTVVDFSAQPVYACASAFMNATLLQIGRRYGTWIGDATYTLKVNQNLMPAAVVSQAAPDLSVVAFRADRDIPAAARGNTVPYIVGVGNINGSADAHHVVLTATVPSMLSFISADPPATRVVNGQPVWDAGTLTSTTYLVKMMTQVNPAVAVGSVLTVTANASTADAEVNLADNHDEAPGLLIQPRGPDLVVESGLDSAAMTVDQPVTATIDVTNYGNDVAPNTQLELTLPPSVTLQSAVPATSTQSSNEVTWNLGILNVDASQRITVTLSLDPAIQLDKAITYSVKATTTGTDIDPDNNSQTITRPVTFGGSDAAVWMSVSGGTEGVSSGQDLTYALGYANYGNQTAPTTTVTMTLDSGLSIVSVTPTLVSMVSGTVLGWDLGNLPVGTLGSLQIHAHVNSVPPDGSMSYATIQSAGFDIDPSNNAALDLRRLSTSNSRSFNVFLPLALR